MLPVYLNYSRNKNISRNNLARKIEVL